MVERTSPVYVGAAVRFTTVDHSETVSQAKRNAPARRGNPAAWTGLSAGGKLDNHRSALSWRG
jgi:hypothetical protein